MNTLKKMMLAALFAMVGLCGTAWAKDMAEIPYQTWDPELKQMVSKSCPNYTVVKDTMAELNSGWYVVGGTVVIDRSADAEPYKPGLKVNGDVHLILCDGAELVVTGATAKAGIEVGAVDSVTNSLTIYGQVNQTGKLTVSAQPRAAGIGGSADQSCGLVTINGGVVSATAEAKISYAAGIGGGSDGVGGIITINAGRVTAKGGRGGSGIGSGGCEKNHLTAAGGVVVINGGIVTATGLGGAGIGGSQCSGTGTLTINDGIVTAQSENGAGAGVGGGVDGAAWTVVINGGKLTASGTVGSGIGTGAVMNIGTGNGGDVTINGGEVIAISYSTDIGGGVRAQSDGIGAGYKITDPTASLDPGTLNLSSYAAPYYIYAGMDTNGVEVTEVQAADFATWHTNCYVQITKTKRSGPAAAEGSPENPWNVGETGSEDTVQAYTNGIGGLVLKGEGTVVSKPWLDNAAGITEIAISDSGVNLSEGAFAGMGSDAAKVNLKLPDGWTGDLPDAGDNWFGAKAEITTWPLMVRNVTFLQRYPWNGYVDIYADVYGPVTNGVRLYVSAFDGRVPLKVSDGYLEGDNTVDLENGLKRVHIAWWSSGETDQTVNSTNITIGVSIARDESADETTIWEGNTDIRYWNATQSYGPAEGFDWVNVPVGSKLKVYFTPYPDGERRNPDNQEQMVTAIRVASRWWGALPSWRLQAGDDYDGNVYIVETDPTVKSVILAANDMVPMVAEGGITICGAFLHVTKFALIDPVYARSEAGRLDLRRPIIVESGASDVLTYSQTMWGDKPNGTAVNILFGKVGATRESVQTGLTGDGVVDFTYPTETGRYEFQHEILENPQANASAMQLPEVIVAWYIGADDPQSVYAYTNDNGMVIIEGTGAMKDFGDCGPWGEDITGVTISEGVTSIGKQAFFACRKLESVTIPASVKVIGDSAFMGGNSLTNVSFAADSQLESVGRYGFAGCAMREMTIPASLKILGEGIFYESYYLSNVTFAADSQLETIGETAFAMTALAEVTIPASVTNIEMGAFVMCNNLTDVTVLATEPPTAGVKLFDADINGTILPSLTAIKVPVGTVEDYKQADGWSAYANLITDGTVAAVETTYYAWNGTEVTGPLTTNAIPVTADMTELNSGWYVVQGVVSNFTGIVVKGDAHLILADGAELYANGGDYAGICVNVVGGGATNSISIYGQENNTGKLIAIGGEEGAGIGAQCTEEYLDTNWVLPIDCGVVTIHGGDISAASEDGSGIGSFDRGETHCGDYGGTITIYGGRVNAVGGANGAGIGSCGCTENPDSYDDAPSCRVTIYGGEITAGSMEEMSASGIGGGVGRNGGIVTIHGGTVEARGFQSAGIGGGTTGAGGTVTIHGGDIQALSLLGAGIGGGLMGAGGTVTISGGEVTAISYPYQMDPESDPFYGEAIGAGLNMSDSQLSSGTLNLDGYAGVKILAGMNADGSGAVEVAAADFLDHGDVIGWHANCYVKISAAQTPTVETTYYAWNGTEVTGPLTTNAIPVTADMTELNSGWYVVQGEVTLTGKSLEVTGHAHLILEDGASLKVSTDDTTGLPPVWYNLTEGETISLSVYGQAEGTGCLEADATSSSCTAIGTAQDLPLTGGFNLHGGAVVAKGSQGAAGIGSCGRSYSFIDGEGWFEGLVVNVYGGQLTAVAGLGGAGIGCGMESVGPRCMVNVQGGEVFATGSDVGQYFPGVLTPAIGWGYGTEPVEPYASCTIALGDNMAIWAGNDNSTGDFSGLPRTTVADYCVDPRAMFVHIAPAPAAAEGSPENPWNVGVEGAEDTVQAYTNGTGKVIVTGEGTPKTLGEGEEPWAGAVPAITEIVVPTGRVPEFKAKWPALADKITDGTVETTYYAWNGTEVTGPLTTNAIPVTADMTELNSGWYVVQGQVVIDRSGIRDEELYKHGLVVNGDVHLILADDAKLVVTGVAEKAGIEVAVVGSVTNSLTIYGQEACTGFLDAFTGDDGLSASIGGSCEHPDCGRVRIDGGHVQAYALKYGAGIGGGLTETYTGGYGGDITINDGTVTVVVGDGGGAGIGGGTRSKGGSVTINGGHVAIRVDDDEARGAGIGAGAMSEDFSVTINGGTIDVNLLYDEENGSTGAGIGNGYMSSGVGEVTINGGTVTSRSLAGAGIGSGIMCAPGVKVEINGGTVFAEGGRVYHDSCNGGAGIGGGSASSGADVLINGGTVTAIAQPVLNDDTDKIVWSSGVGAGCMADPELLAMYEAQFGVGSYVMGTFALGPNTTASIVSGMDTNGVEVSAVQADAYGSLENPGWCTNCYVKITAALAPVAMIVTDNGAKTNLYASVQEAFDSEFTANPAVTNTVTLLRDYTETRVISIRESMVSMRGTTILGNESDQNPEHRAVRLDLNGHTLAGGYADSESVTPTLIGGMGTVLIVDDSSEAQTGAIRRFVQVEQPNVVQQGLLGAKQVNIYAFATVLLEGCDFTLKNGTIAAGRAEHKEKVVGGAITGIQSFLTIEGGTVEGCDEDLAFKFGICNMTGMLTITGGKVKDAIVNAQGEGFAISGGLFGTDDVNNHPDWLANGATCVANDDAATLDEGYTWKVVAPAEGAPENPWNVGVEGSEDTVQAYTNGTGKVFVTGEGTPKTLGEGEEPWAGAVPAITEIVVPTGRVPEFKAKWPALKDLITDGTVEVAYYTWNEVAKVVDGPYTTNAIPVTADMTTLGSGWYVVMGKVDIVLDPEDEDNYGKPALSVNGDAHLVLMDDVADLTLSGGERAPGLEVSIVESENDNMVTNSLTIYGQAKGTGRLTASGSGDGTGIGGARRCASGVITINGGTVSAVGSGENAAGIGGGVKAESGSVVTINGGTVFAQGAEQAPGIGDGGECEGGCVVTINGGTVTANGGAFGAGIGGGAEWCGGTISINGGTVKACGIAGAGIGGGMMSPGGTVTINGGDVTAIGLVYEYEGMTFQGDSIGAGCAYGGKDDVPELLPGTFEMNYPGAKVYTSANTVGLWAEEVGQSEFSTWHSKCYAHIVSGELPQGCPERAWAVGVNPPDSVLAYTNGLGQLVVEGNGVPKTLSEGGEPWVDCEVEGIRVPFLRGDEFKTAWPHLAYMIEDGTIPVEYYAWDGTKVAGPYTTNAIIVTSETTTLRDGLWYVVKDKVEILRDEDSEWDGLAVVGSANLILMDDVGELTLQGGEYCAGLSVAVDESRDDDSMTTNSLAIYGQAKGTGRLTARGGSGAGIGGYCYGGCGTLSIHGGIIEAVGGSGGAGIGGGIEADGGCVTIYGGVVTARAGHQAAGIGGGFPKGDYEGEGRGGQMLFYGGVVTAIGGGEDCDCIGGGRDSLVPGTFQLGSETTAKILVNEAESVEGAMRVEAAGFADWHRKHFVYIGAPSATILSAKSMRPGGEWNGKANVGYSLLGLDENKAYELAFTLTVGDKTVEKKVAVDPVADGDRTYEIDSMTYFGEMLQDPAAQLTLTLTEVGDGKVRSERTVTFPFGNYLDLTVPAVGRAMYEILQDGEPVETDKRVSGTYVVSADTPVTVHYTPVSGYRFIRGGDSWSKVYTTEDLKVDEIVLTKDDVFAEIIGVERLPVAMIVTDNGATTNFYASVQEAFDSEFTANPAVTNTVTLLRDYTETQVLTNIGDFAQTGSTLLGVKGMTYDSPFEPRTARLDLNGFTLTGGCSEDVLSSSHANKTGAVIIVGPGSVLIIDDSSAEKTGQIRKPMPSEARLAEKNDVSANASLGMATVMYEMTLPIISVMMGDLTLEGGTICGQAIRVNEQIGLIGIYNMGRFAMTGGTIRDCSVDGAAVAHGICSMQGATTISDGKVKDAIELLDEGSTVSISGGLFGTDDVKNNPEWLAEGMTCLANDDPVTLEEGYFWTVGTPTIAKLTGSYVGMNSDGTWWVGFVATDFVGRSNLKLLWFAYGADEAADAATTWNAFEAKIGAEVGTIALDEILEKVPEGYKGEFGVGYLDSRTISYPVPSDIKDQAMVFFAITHEADGKGYVVDALGGIRDMEKCKEMALLPTEAVKLVSPGVFSQLGEESILKQGFSVCRKPEGGYTLTIDGELEDGEKWVTMYFDAKRSEQVAQPLLWPMMEFYLGQAVAENIAVDPIKDYGTFVELTGATCEIPDTAVTLFVAKTHQGSGRYSSMTHLRNYVIDTMGGFKDLRAIAAGETGGNQIGESAGNKNVPWKVGPDGSDLPQAYTNGNGGLVIKGEGTVEKKPWLEEGVKDGITEIAIKDPGTELPEDAFEGMGSDDEKIKIILPDNWQGELPDEDGNWYGAKAEIGTWPFMIRNVTFQQRYPWIGYVDIFADVYGPVTNVNVYVSAFNGEARIPASLIDADSLTVDLTNGVTKAHFVWDAEGDLGDSFRSSDVSIKVALHEDVSMPHALPAIAERMIWDGKQQFTSWMKDVNVEVPQGDKQGWSTVAAGSRLSIRYVPIGTGENVSKLAVYTLNENFLPSLLNSYNPKEGITLEKGSTDFQMNLTQDDLDAIVKEGGLAVNGAYIEVTGISLRDPMPDVPSEPERPQVSSVSEAGRLDLRYPLIVAAGSVDEITYSANLWGSGNRDEVVNIRFGRLYSENIPDDVSTVPTVFENLEGTGVEEFTYPERAGLYLFVHEIVPAPNANKKTKILYAPVYVVWYIGADDDPESVYAIDYGNGEIVIMGNGRMKDFAECGPWGTDITGVVIKEGVWNVGANAFKGCTKMTHAELPESMKVIGNGAFAGATGLRTILNEAWEPPVFDGDPFTGVVKDDVIVYVPGDVYDAYASSEYWSPFWLKNMADHSELSLDVEMYPGVEFTVTVGWIDMEPQVYKSSDYTDFFSVAIPYGEQVTLTAKITDGVSVFDDYSTEKTIVWNFWTYEDYVSSEIAPHGADWITLQNALAGTPPEELRGALEYENADGTNVIRLCRDIVTQTACDRTLTVTGAAVLDLAGHDIVYSNGMSSVISVGTGDGSRLRGVQQGAVLQHQEFVRPTAVPGWLTVVDSSAEGAGRIAKARAETVEQQHISKKTSLQASAAALGFSCGIAVQSGSTFVMEGGVLTNCFGYDAGGVYNEGAFVLAGGVIAGNAVSGYIKASAEVVSADVLRGSNRDGIMNAYGGTLVITGGQVKDGICDENDAMEPAVAISGGFFGTEDVMKHPDWVVENFLCIENDDEATIAEGYGWRVVTLVKGSKWNPWDVGAGDDPGAVKAYTNDNKLVIRGEGDVKDKPLPWDDLIDSVPEIVIEDGVTGLPDDAFTGGGTEDEPMVIELPDLWPGEMPGPNGEWYGGYAKFAEGHYPLVVRNIRFQQRYPWNNLVDIDFDLYGSTNSVKLDIVAQCGSKVFDVRTLVGGESGFTFTDVEGCTSHHVVWDAGADILNARQRKFRCDNSNIYIGPEGTVSVGGSVIKEIDDYYVYTVAGSKELSGIYPIRVTSEDFADFRVGDRMVLAVYNNGKIEDGQQVGFYPVGGIHKGDSEGALYVRSDFPEGMSDAIVEFTQEMKNVLDQQGYFYISCTYASLRVKSVAKSGKSGTTASSEVAGPLDLVTGARWAHEREGILADPAWADGAALTLGWLNGQETIAVNEATNATWIAGRYGEGTYRFTLTGADLDYAVTFFIPKDGQTVLADELLASDVTIDSGEVRVYGETVIASGATLTIAEGVPVTFDPGSGFRVEEGGHIFAPSYEVSVDPETGLVTLTERPRPTVSNIRFSQRYPWNGLIDIYADVAYAADPSTGVWVRIEAEMLSGQSQQGQKQQERLADKEATASAKSASLVKEETGLIKEETEQIGLIDYEEKESGRSTAIMARTLYLAADPSVTNEQFKVAQGPVHLVWDAKADLPPETFGDFNLTVLAALDKMVTSAPSSSGCLCFTAVPDSHGTSSDLMVALIPESPKAAENNAAVAEEGIAASEQKKEEEPLVREGVNIQISLDGKNWGDYVIGKYVTVPIGSKIYWRGNNPNGLSTARTTYRFAVDGGAFEASGSVMSLIDPTCKATAIPNDYCFARLFYACSGILTAPELPATELMPYCYTQMFYKDNLMRTAPVLPAAEVPEGAYRAMFSNCNRVTEVKMDATYLAKGAIASWLNGSAPTGTLYLNGALDGTIPVDSSSGIPIGWSAVYSGTPVRPPAPHVVIVDKESEKSDPPPEAVVAELIEENK